MPWLYALSKTNWNDKPSSWLRSSTGKKCRELCFACILGYFVICQLTSFPQLWLTCSRSWNLNNTVSLPPENASKLADQACYQIEPSTRLGPTVLSQFELISSYLEANGWLLPVVLFPDSAHLRIWNIRVCTKVLMSGGVEVPRATKDKVIPHWASNLDLLGIAQLLLSLPSLC